MHPADFTKDALRKMYHPNIYDLDEDEEQDMFDQFFEIDFEDNFRREDVLIDPDMYDLMDEEFFEEQAKLALNYEFGTIWPGSQKVPYSADEQKYFYDLHNLYRMNTSDFNIPAADLVWMVWDDMLTDLAQEYCYWCVFEHGFPYHTYQAGLGQNLYIGPSNTPGRSMYLWYIEYKYHDFNTYECLPKKRCGHMTQLLWSTSYLLGCARHYCWPDRGSWIITCHYWPPGNDRRFPTVYTIGIPCSRCNKTNLSTLCYNNICVSRDECDKYDLSCECILKCKNCGVLSRETCTCSCPAGWDYNDCGSTCENFAEPCKTRKPEPGFQKRCRNVMHHLGYLYCRFACRICLQAYQYTGDKSDLCCTGKSCERDYELNLKTCECELTCPSQKCLIKTYQGPHLLFPDYYPEKKLTYAVRTTTPSPPPTQSPPPGPAPPPPPPRPPPPEPPRTEPEEDYPIPIQPPPEAGSSSTRIFSTVSSFEYFWPQVLGFITWLFLM